MYSALILSMSAVLRVSAARRLAGFEAAGAAGDVPVI
jgi:hypothetical protein